MRWGVCCWRQLFLRTAAPIAVDRTRGALYRGMRLMAIDGVTFDGPDTPGNPGAPGPPSADRKHDGTAKPWTADIHPFT